MKVLLAFTFLILSIVGKCQTAGELLEKAYKTRSNESLKQFFQNWHQEIQPISETELSNLNDTFRQAYRVFTEFYKPQSIDSLGGSEWGNDIYKNVDFLVIQNFIKIYFTDKLYFTDQETDDYIVDYINKNIEEDSVRKNLLKRTDGKLSQFVMENFGPDRSRFYERGGSLRDSIIDFRPAINSNGKLPLYLTPKYSEVLNAFLGNKHLPLGAGGIMNPARSTGQSEKRKKFLENYIKIWYGHWGGYWQLYSYPEVYSITFDKNMKYAKVDFRMVYEGGEALLKNDNGRWIFISAERTWIE